MGIMSGTSIDGIDISIVKTNGYDLYPTNIKFTNKYSINTQRLLRDLISSKNQLIKSNDFIFDLENSITNDYLDSINIALKKYKNNVEIIGLHGQTIFHSPKLGKSIQLGNAQKIANMTKIRVVNNFRQNDILNGGQGAPLAPIYHKYLIKKLKLDLPSCIINIGGISNITYYNAKTLIGFDVGPGNVLMNDYVFKHLGMEFDLDGDLASKGNVDLKLVDDFLNHKFFKKNYPKSADRSDFHMFLENSSFKNLNVKDALSTLSFLTAKSISISITSLPQKPLNIIVAGGGQYNKFLISTIDKLTDSNLITADSLNIDGNFVEAELIAYIAARSIYNLPFTFPLTTGVDKPLTGGEVSFPNRNLL